MSNFEWAGQLLRRGDSGSSVRQIQEVLNKLGLDTGGVDGDFGPKTEAAVRALQQKAGVSADGIFGPMTAGAVNGLLDQLVEQAAGKVGGKVGEAMKSEAGKAAIKAVAGSFLGGKDKK